MDAVVDLLCSKLKSREEAEQVLLEATKTVFKSDVITQNALSKVLSENEASEIAKAAGMDEEGNLKLEGTKTFLYQPVADRTIKNKMLFTLFFQ